MRGCTCARTHGGRKPALSRSCFRYRSMDRDGRLDVQPRRRRVAAVAAEQLRRQWKKILKSGKHLDRLDPQHLHRLRIQAKKLRYAAEFFAPTFPRKRAIRRRKDFVASLQQLQDALGELNDIAVNEK